MIQQLKTAGSFGSEPGNLYMYRCVNYFSNVPIKNRHQDQALLSLTEANTKLEVARWVLSESDLHLQPEGKGLPWWCGVCSQAVCNPDFPQSALL